MAARKGTQYEIDMCSGPILSKMLLFSVPLMCSSILQLLFNAADIVVVGRWAGDNSLAAVGSNTALIGLLTNLFVGLAVGANTLAAKYYGARDRMALYKTVHTSMLLSLLSGLLLALFMSNAGGLWDNSKKYVEAGNEGGKGSEAHKAAVIGDTVGDPFKDTAGPSINTQITVVSLVSSLLSSVFVMFSFFG